MASTLATLERRIEDTTKRAWLDNGRALREIQDRGLYKARYGTFDEYVQKRWDRERTWAYLLIGASKTHDLIAENVDKNPALVNIQMPRNEGQIRPLTRLEPAEAVHVWCEVATANDRPTQAKVEEAVRAFKANPVPVKPVTIPAATLTSSSGGVLYTSGANDECYTPEYAVRALLPHLERFRGQRVWCPFDREDSQFVRVLRDEGHSVIRSHIDDGHDFYTHIPLDWGLMVSNPPFTDKRKIFERAIELGKPFALVMSNTWLNDAAPKQIFRGINFQLLMFEERMKFLNQDNSENKITFSSSYFCVDFLEQTIMFDSLKNYGYRNG
jgi:hypothetical protein